MLPSSTACSSSGGSVTLPLCSLCPFQRLRSGAVPAEQPRRPRELVPRRKAERTEQVLLPDRLGQCLRDPVAAALPALPVVLFPQRRAKQISLLFDSLISDKESEVEMEQPSARYQVY